MKKILLILLSALVLSYTLYNCSIQTSLRKDEVAGQLDKVCRWQMAHFDYATEGSAGFLHDYGIDAWTNAVLYIGIADWARTSGNQAYYEWLSAIGQKNAWQMPENFITHPRYGIYHADELCIGQFYQEMYAVYKDVSMLTSVKNRIDRIMDNPPEEGMQARNKQKWSWCDALFMAPPVYARMAQLIHTAQSPQTTQEKGQKGGRQTDGDTYLAFMHSEFMDTYEHLYDNENELFFRDDSYFDKKEANGQKVFWGRGNGWVVAGLARILQFLPADYEHRPFYEELFVRQINRLLMLRDKNGYWHASLLDPDSYPSPETSATALITYAMAYGVNSRLLDKKRFLPHIEQSWMALTAMVDENGKLGYVQPIGADPRKVTHEMTAVYGVGAFLMAGHEIYRLIQ